MTRKIEEKILRCQKKFRVGPVKLKKIGVDREIRVSGNKTFFSPKCDFGKSSYGDISPCMLSEVSHPATHS